MAREEMVIFTRTFDLLDWLLPGTNSFPRAHRHTFTRRLLDAAFDLRERLEEANHRRGRARLERLERADEALTRCGSTCGWPPAGVGSRRAVPPRGGHGDRDRPPAGRLDQADPGGSSEDPPGCHKYLRRATRELRASGRWCGGGPTATAGWCVAGRSTIIRGTSAAPTATGTTRTTGTTTTGFGWWWPTIFSVAGTARRPARPWVPASGPRLEKRRGPSLAAARIPACGSGRIATAPPPGRTLRRGTLKKGILCTHRSAVWDNLLLAYRKARARASGAAGRGRLRIPPGGQPDRAAGTNCRTRTYGPGPYASLLHPRAQAPADHRRAIPRPGRPPRPVQRHRADL